MSKKADVIRVWRCDKCCAYEINFNVDILYCSICGHKKTKKIYKEVIKQEK